jgi:hypothetical protein
MLRMTNRFQAFLNCFYYVGAFSETIGHANRVARFLLKASLAKSDGNVDAFVLKSEASGDVALSRRRAAQEVPGQNPRLESIIAEFSHVTVKNPANMTLVQDLTMQAMLHHDTSRSFFDDIPHRDFSSSFRLPAGKAVLSPGRQAAASPRYCALSVVYGPLPTASLGAVLGSIFNERKTRRGNFMCVF